MKRILKVVLMAAFIIVTLGHFAAAKGVPRNRDCFHHRHYNEAGVCLIASYASILEYANSSNEQVAPFDNFDVLSLYLQYHDQEESCNQHSAEEFRHNQKEVEKDFRSIIDKYCIARSMSGYIRIHEFHTWLKDHSYWADNVEFVKRVPEAKYNEIPLDYAYSDLESYLKQNADRNAEYDYVALLIFPLPSGSHSVMLSFDQDYFIRDINLLDRFVDLQGSFDFLFTPEAKIWEYMIFKVKRQPESRKRWIEYNPTAFRASTKDEDEFMVLDKPIPVRHLRITALPYGEDGTKDYTGIKIRSFSDPNYELVYHNWYDMPTVSINGEYKALGQRAYKGTYELDLGQQGDDLYIWGYQPNFNFKNFSYQ